MQNIPHEFTKQHSMWQYHNALLRYNGDHEFYVDVDLEPHSDRPGSKNHVTINCQWREIIEECDWEKNKMVRFKLVDKIKDDKASLSSKNRVLIPVFHMC
jgi:hypothetical protein